MARHVDYAFLDMNRAGFFEFLFGELDHLVDIGLADAILLSQMWLIDTWCPWLHSRFLRHLVLTGKTASLPDAENGIQNNSRWETACLFRASCGKSRFSSSLRRKPRILEF